MYDAPVDTTLTMPVAALIASIIGATATITAALIQLTISWRREMKARAGRDPVSRRTRRSMVGSVFVLMGASAIGGFALSQYMVSQDQAQAAAVESETRARLDRLTAVAERLERAAADATRTLPAMAVPGHPSPAGAVPCSASDAPGQAVPCLPVLSTESPAAVDAVHPVPEPSAMGPGLAAPVAP